MAQALLRPISDPTRRLIANSPPTPAEPDARRLMFVGERDGLSDALEYAKRTLRIYRKAVLNPKHFASTPYYRCPFIASYLFLKRYWRPKSREPYRAGND